LKHKGALIRGVAEAAARGQENMTSFYRPSISYLPEKDLVAKQIYQQSGLKPSDIDAASSTTRSRRSCSGSSSRTASATAASRPRSCATATCSSAGRLPDEHARRPAERGVHHGMNGVNEGVRLIRGTSLNQPKKNDHVLVTAGVGYRRADDPRTDVGPRDAPQSWSRNREIQRCEKQ
jgi:hypothetical protein